jgi:hypothetical protein
VSDPELQGVVPRAISHLGAGIADASAEQEALFKVSLSVVVGGRQAFQQRSEVCQHTLATAGQQQEDLFPSPRLQAS